ncbi:MAG TPA: L-rhamnose mutarotase [Puia sp.]|nr:L-rhamnose mutarotase [Puia sp.]
MQRFAFTMILLDGFADEYKKRHDAIWPELTHLLNQKGIHDYSIFLDESTNTLFGYLTIENIKELDELPNEPLMQKWWSYMKDIMETNADNSPKTVSLREVFHLP